MVTAKEERLVGTLVVALTCPLHNLMRSQREHQAQLSQLNY